MKVFPCASGARARRASILVPDDRRDFPALRSQRDT